MKTWRYLRVAMIVLTAGLGIAILVEWWQVGRGCWLGSISAYYYTPVNAYFIAALVGIGVCLVCLRGNTDGEDALLNLAGMFAGVVALVPTKLPDFKLCETSRGTLIGVATDSGKQVETITIGTTSVRLDDFEEIVEANIENNAIALFFVGVLGLCALWWFAQDTHSSPEKARSFAAAFLTVVGAVVVYLVWPDWFLAHAHITAAVLMFVCIGVVVALNSLQCWRKGKKKRAGVYLSIAAGMALSVAVIAFIRFAFGWTHWFLWIEIALLALFALFWIVQSRELWYEGLRGPEPETD